MCFFGCLGKRKERQAFDIDFVNVWLKIIICLLMEFCHKRLIIVLLKKGRRVEERDLIFDLCELLW